MFVGIPKLRLLAVLCALMAMGVSVYLLIHAFAPDATIPGCGDGGCHVVLQSKWSVWYGIPVVSFGLIVYGGLILAMCSISFARRVETRRMARLAIDGCSAAILFGVLYFFLIQAVVLHAFCRLCMTAHAFGLLAVVFCYLSSRGGKVALATGSASEPNTRNLVNPMLTRQMAAESGGSLESPTLPHRAIVVAGSCLLFSAFAIGHFFDEGPETLLVVDAPDLHAAANRTSEQGQITSDPNGESRPPESDGEEANSKVTAEAAAKSVPGALDRSTSNDGNEQEPPIEPIQTEAFVQLPGGVEIPLGRFPTMGDDWSKPVFVELFDYTCKSCRQMHRGLQRVLPGYSDKIVLVAIPCPLNRKCHPDLPSSVEDHVGACEHAKIALAVWKVAPDRFKDFHDWVFERRPTPEMALRRANRIMGVEAIQTALDDPSVDEDLEIASRLFRDGNRAIMPKIYLPTGRVVMGIPQSYAALRKVFNDELLKIQRDAARDLP